MKSLFHLIKEEHYSFVSVDSHLKQLGCVFDDANVTVFIIIQSTQVVELQNSCGVHSTIYTF